MAGKYPNSGILSRNQRRRDDTDPEYSGSAEINGQEYWISAWVKEGDKGKYFKMSFKPKQPQQSGGREQSRGRAPQNDDDMPF